MRRIRLEQAKQEGEDGDVALQNDKGECSASSEKRWSPSRRVVANMGRSYLVAFVHGFVCGSTGAIDGQVIQPAMYDEYCSGTHHNGQQ